MEVKKKWSKSLYMLFLMYLAAFFLCTIVLIMLFITAVLAGINTGMILPANYAEQAIKQVQDQIAQSEVFDEAQIPFPCTYLLLDEEGNILSGNMDREDISRAQESMKEAHSYSMEYYLPIQRKDSVCVVRYDMYAHFASPALNRLFPMLESSAMILFWIVFFVMAIFIAVIFGRKLKRELIPIMNATDAIKNQNLEFQMIPTKIKEFNQVLDSIDEMRNALEESLKQQWNLEKNRKMQISAITHDIKTPLTIIQGNTQLLLETETSEENREILKYIDTSSDKIERYLSLLMTAVKAENEQDFKPDYFSVPECIQEIEGQAKARCTVQSIQFLTQIIHVPDTCYGDKELIIRAVCNILDNAVEHTPGQGTIEFAVSCDLDKLIFTVTDSGNGFTQESLQCAAQQFYTECGERSGKHYGLGLFIAKSVAMKHGGELLTANRQDGCGAVVTFWVPYKNDKNF